MDDIGLSNQHSKNISNISVTVLLVILQAYLMIFSNGIDVFDFTMIENDVFRYIVQVLVQVIVLAFIYPVIYFIVKRIYCNLWIREHKGCWIKGTWLHIHVKNDIRIGIVDIKQNFNTIKVSGRNLSLRDGIKRRNETKWNYWLGEVFDINIENADRMIGCYSAKEDTHAPKFGMHDLSIEVDTRGCPVCMKGVFSDTFNSTDLEKPTDAGTLNVGKHMGKLYFYRLSDKCREYLYVNNVLQEDRLKSIYDNDELRDEPYVKKLVEIMAEKPETVNLPVNSSNL